MKTIKINVGLDISKDSFDASIIKMLEDLKQKVAANKKFKNNHDGFMQLKAWVFDKIKDEVEIHFTMEATGVYYEGLAYFLHESKYIVHVVLPNKAKKFIESLDIKSKTDKLDAQSLGRMGVERHLRVWNPCSVKLKSIRFLTRERESIIHHRTMLKNQLHALMLSVGESETSIARTQELITFIDNQVTTIEKEIKALISKDIELSRKSEILLTIPGIGITTIATVVAETNGFASIENKKQLTSYAGYDIKIRESGAWKGKPKISKKGNSHIRAALYFPAFTVSRLNEEIKEDYERIKNKKKLAMVANTTIQRKLLCLMYTLWKTEKEFKGNYQKEELEKASISGIA